MMLVVHNSYVVTSILDTDSSSLQENPSSLTEDHIIVTEQQTNNAIHIDDQWDNAHFLLRMSQEQSLTHNGVNSLCETVQDFADRVCEKVEQRVEVKLRNTNLDESTIQEILSDCKPGDLFKGLKSRYSREKYYQLHFNYMVCVYATVYIIAMLIQHYLNSLFPRYTHVYIVLITYHSSTQLTLE